MQQTISMVVRWLSRGMTRNRFLCVVVVAIGVGSCGGQQVESSGDVARLMAAPAQLEEAGTLRFEAHRVSNVGRSYEEWLVDGEVDLAAELARYRRTNNPEDDAGMEILQASQGLYAASPSPECRPWLLMEEGVTFPPIHPVWLLASADQMDVDYVGVDAVDGVETRHYRLHAEADLYQKVSRSEGSLDPTGGVQLEAWLDRDGWIRKFSRVLIFGDSDDIDGGGSTRGAMDNEQGGVSGERPQPGATVSSLWRLWDFGEPLNIEPPAQGELGTDERLGPDPLGACEP